MVALFVADVLSSGLRRCPPEPLQNLPGRLIGRIQAHHLLKLRLCLGPAPRRVHQRNREVESRRDQSRPQSHRFAKLSYRIFDLIGKSRQCVAEVVVGFGEIGPDFERRPKLVDGLGSSSRKSQQDASQVVVRLGQSRLKSQGRLVFGNGLFGPALDSTERVAKIVMHEGVARVQAQRSLELLDCFAQTPRLARQSSCEIRVANGIIGF